MEQRLQIMSDANIIDEEVKDQILKIYNDVLANYNLNGDESHLFLTHLAMAMMRLKKEEGIASLGADIKKEIKSNPNWIEAEIIIDDILLQTSVDLSVDELDYLYLHMCTILSAQQKKHEILVDGYTLMHEHMTIDLSKVKGDLDCCLDCFEDTVLELKELYQYGVRNILDVTLIGMGRNIDYIKSISSKTKMNILSSTGFYKEPFLPSIVQDESVEILAEGMIQELTQGIEDDVQAVIIGEIGCSKNEMTELEKKVFDAAILAAKKTGAPITTHTTLGTYALEQARYLIERGIESNKIIIGHQDLSNDINQILELLALGVYVGIDTIGKINYVEDVRRAEIIFDLQSKGYLNKVILSMDITRKSNLKTYGGKGYTYLFTDFLPLLRSLGVKDESIEMMLKENPKAIFRRESL